MDILTSGERLKLIEHMHAIRYQLQEWVFVQIELATDEPAHSMHNILAILEKQFAGSVGKILVCNQKEILMIMNTSKEKKTHATIAGEIKERLPAGSCEIEIFPPNKEGLRRIELRLAAPATKNGYQKARQQRLKNIFMVADDDMFMRSIMKKIIGPDNETIEIMDGTAVVGEYLKYLPDVLFLDIHLPGREGPQILHEILGIDPDAYVIMISSDSSRENVVASVTNGAHGFLAKPIVKEKVLEHIIKCPTIHAASRAAS